MTNGSNARWRRASRFAVIHLHVRAHAQHAAVRVHPHAGAAAAEKGVSGAERQVSGGEAEARPGGVPAIAQRGRISTERRKHGHAGRRDVVLLRRAEAVGEGGRVLRWRQLLHLQGGVLSGREAWHHAQLVCGAVCGRRGARRGGGGRRAGRAGGLEAGAAGAGGRGERGQHGEAAQRRGPGRAARQVPAGGGGGGGGQGEARARRAAQLAEGVQPARVGAHI
ncbi:hypothetical protein FGB62_1g551 [Gracilaria domingensis]|nr:hypothetical protein FGB62_1g551 [Gracilaria domingensis]